jgi:flagellar FliL protein
MASTTQLKTAAEPAEGKKKSKKKLIIIVVAVLLVGGGGGYFMFGRGGSSAPPKPVKGVVVPLDPITINLAAGHFLKLGIALQATKAAAEPPDGSEALDIAIAIFSNRTVAELNTAEGREKFKKELIKEVVAAYQDPKTKVQEVMDVFLTSFVMQ